MYGYLWLRFISVNKFRCDFFSNYFENENKKKIFFPYFLNDKLNDKVNETRKKSVIGLNNFPDRCVYRIPIGIVLNLFYQSFNCPNNV